MLTALPNILTLLRLSLAPVFAFLVFIERLDYALAVFIVAGATDAFDGFIARRFGGSSRFGALLDPLADKFLLTTSYLALTYKGFLPLWLCAFVVARDIIMLLSISALKWRGAVVSLAPNIFGKLTTVLQTVTVLYGLAIGTAGWLFGGLAVLTVIITVVSGLGYGLRLRKIR